MDFCESPQLSGKVVAKLYVCITIGWNNFWISTPFFLMHLQFHEILCSSIRIGRNNFWISTPFLMQLRFHEICFTFFKLWSYYITVGWNHFKWRIPISMHLCFHKIFQYLFQPIVLYCTAHVALGLVCKFSDALVCKFTHYFL